MVEAAHRRRRAAPGARGWSSASSGAPAVPGPPRSRARSGRSRPARRRRGAVVLDCDPLGPGADRVLGLDGVDGFRWDALCQTTGRLQLRGRCARRCRGATRSACSPGTPAPPPALQAFAVREALSAARRGHDTVVRRPAALRRPARRGGRGALRRAAGRGRAHRRRCGVGVRLSERLVHAAARRGPCCAGAASRSARSPGPPGWPCWTSCRTSGRWPSRSTSGSGRSGRDGGRSPAPAAACSTPAPTSPRGSGTPRHEPRLARGRPRRTRRRRPRPAGPGARRAHAAPGGRGAARRRPAGRRRHGARGPRGAAPRRRRRRAARAAAAAAGRHRRARQRVGAGLPRPRRRAGAPPTSASPTTPPCAGWLSAWPPRQGGVSTTPRRTPTCGCPTAPASTPSWPRWPARAP